MEKLKKGNNLGEGEIIIEKYSCAANLKILIQGKLFVSNQALYFHSYLNDKHLFFGKHTKLKLPYEDIQFIIKNKLAQIIDNSIMIKLQNGFKLQLTSFVKRDICFDLIFRTWQFFLQKRNHIQTIEIKHFELPEMMQSPNQENENILDSSSLDQNKDIDLQSKINANNSIVSQSSMENINKYRESRSSQNV